MTTRPRPSDDDSRSHAPHAAALRSSARVSPLELFFDLVFVLAITQCTALMASTLTWMGVVQALLVLAMLWWAWVGYAWLTSVIDPEDRSARLAIIGAMAGLLVCAVAVIEVFGDTALLFVGAYAVVRAGQLVLFALASVDNPRLRHSVRGLAISSGIAVAVLAIAATFDGWAQVAVWALALVLDAGGPYLFGSEGWNLEPAHFAERHGLFVLIALGESIVAIGVGAGSDLDAGVVTSAVLGVVVAAALWWLYFDAGSEAAATRLATATPGAEQNEMARDSYSYLHFPMVAGIVLVALGLKKTLAHVGDPLELIPTTGLAGGVSLYLFAHVGFRLRTTRRLATPRLAIAVLLAAAIPIVRELPALATLGIVCAALVGLVVIESLRRTSDDASPASAQARSQ